MKAWAVCIVLVVSVLHGRTTSAGAAETSAHERNGRVFAYYSTTSYTRLTTTTATRLSTCLSTTTTPAVCKRRKKRTLSHIVDMDDDLNLLETSVNEEVEDRDKRALDNVEAVERVDRQGRILTIWTTAFQTITLTTTSILAGTTVTASAFCTAGDGSPGQTCFR